MRACNHKDDKDVSTFNVKEKWKVGERTIVQDECGKCGRVRRYFLGDLGNEGLLSGRRGVRKGRLVA